MKVKKKRQKPTGVFFCFLLTTHANIRSCLNSHSSSYRCLTNRIFIPFFLPLSLLTTVYKRIICECVHNVEEENCGAGGEAFCAGTMSDGSELCNFVRSLPSTTSGPLWATNKFYVIFDIVCIVFNKKPKQTILIIVDWYLNQIFMEMFEPSHQRATCPKL